MELFNDTSIIKIIFNKYWKNKIKLKAQLLNMH